MRILILQLSDFHLKTSIDPILSRDTLVVDAVKNLDYEVELCVIVLSGDIAYSADDAQYELASAFLGNIKADLASKLGAGNVPVYFVAVPGNHDCFLPKTSKKIREIVVKGILEDKGLVNDPDVVSGCLHIQDSFFAFRDDVAKDCLEAGKTGFHDRLYYFYQFTHKDVKIQVHCYNTAWLSQLHEKQGQLYLPNIIVPRTHPPADLFLSVFHHPYNWLHHETARKFRSSIQKTSDVIFTGHEHVADRRGTTSGVERNEYIEGSAMQSDDLQFSGFNALVIDTELKKQKFISLDYDGTRYKSIGSDGAYVPELHWEPFQVNRLMERGRFELQRTFQEVLDDPGAHLMHRNQSYVKLGDIFVYPDLREVLYRKDIVSPVLRGDKMLDLISEKPYIVILGEDQCGRTSLAKRLFVDLFKSGRLPLFIDGTERPPGGEKVYTYLDDLFSIQYEADALPSYKQVDRQRRVIIVDDYHKLQMSREAKRKFTGSLAKYAGQVIIMASALELAYIDLSKPAEISDDHVAFSFYRILPFGHVLRNSLVERWLQLRSEASDSDGIIRELEFITRNINVAIGQNYVPAYPIYILALLQAAEATAPIEQGASSHSYFYELIIKNTLARGQTQTSYDVLIAYLAHLAYNIFSENTASCDEKAFADIHQKYERKFAIPVSFDGIRKELLAKQIIVNRNGAYRFYYPYLYYYFVALYMRDNAGDERVNTQLVALMQSIHVEQSAHILLFLSHLTKDPSIINELMRTAESQYSGVPEAELSSEVQFLNNLDNTAKQLTFKDLELVDSRRQLLETLDAEMPWPTDEDEIDASEEQAVDEALQPLRDLNAALKTIQILGQVLKNFPGSIPGELKARIATVCCSLGLRCLTSVVAIVDDNELALLKGYFSVIKAHHPKLDEEAARERASATLVGLMKLASLGLMMRTCNAIGSPQLAETYDAVLGGRVTPAYKLLRVCLELEHSGKFPEREVKELAYELRQNKHAESVLKYMVMHHFYMFPTSYKLRQKICAALDISYQRTTLADPSRKLLSNARGGAKIRAENQDTRRPNRKANETRDE